MRRVFADTNYLLAALNRRDPLHGKAASVWSGLQPARVITTEMVFVELLNAMSDDPLLRASAANAVERMRQASNVTLVPQTAEQFAKALRLYKKSVDKEWSLTDCASFLIMQELGIREALTYDQHFVQAGFKALLR